jgi:transcription antitermination factor NusG
LPPHLYPAGTAVALSPTPDRSRLRINVHPVPDTVLTDDRIAIGWDSRLAAPPSDVVEARSSVGWFAIWTRSRHESSVVRQLDEKRIEGFLPTVTRWSRWQDRKKRIDWPLFPGYCFVHIDPAESLPVLKCAGVVNLISVDGKPVPIPDSEIENIRALVTSELKYDPCPLIHEGMDVKVVSGPLRGVAGKLVRKGAHARLVLSVDLIGQAVSVEIDAADVRAN